VERFSSLALKIFSGTTPLAKGSSYGDENTGIPFIRSGEITDDGGVASTHDIFILPEVHEGALRRSQLQQGDVLIAIVGATIGAAGVFAGDYPANINQAIAAVRFNPSKILPRFAVAFLHTKTGQEVLEYLKRPVARANINLEEIGEITLPVPTVEQQNALLEELDSAVELRTKKLFEADALLTDLDAYIEAVLQLTPSQPRDPRTPFAVRLSQVRGRRMDASSHAPFPLPDNPLGIPMKRLDEIAAVDANSAPVPESSETLVPYVGLPECNLSEVRVVSERPFSEVRGRSVAHVGDILFARIEPSIFNKKYVFVDHLAGRTYAYLSTEFYAVRAHGDPDDQRYLYALLHSAVVFNQVKGKTTGSSGRRRLDPEMFASIVLPWPPSATRRAIADEVASRRESARRLRAEADEVLETARSTFAARLLDAGAGARAKVKRA
jgi:hypothetical protein